MYRRESSLYVLLCQPCSYVEWVKQTYNDIKPGVQRHHFICGDTYVQTVVGADVDFSLCAVKSGLWVSSPFLKSLSRSLQHSLVFLSDSLSSINLPASYGCQIDLHFKEANISSLLLHQLFNPIQSNVVNISHRDICAVYKTAQWFQSLVCYCMCHLLYICSRLVLQSVGLAACLIAKLQVSLYLY